MLKRRFFYGALLVVLLGLILVGCGGGKKGSSSREPHSTQTSQEQQQADMKAAFDEIDQLLDSEMVKKATDKTGRRDLYTPFTAFDMYPAWVVTQEADTVRMEAVIMDAVTWEKAKGKKSFVNWQTIIFSTDQEKWEYNIPNCDGSTGGGKEVSTNDKGKYEYFKTEFHNLAPGYRLLVEGTNPNIRLKGISKRKDIKVTEEMIAALKVGLRLDELLIFTRGKIGRPQ